MTLTDQINAVLSAPIPFFFALFIVVVGVWRAFEWAYRATIEKTKSLFELSRSEVQVATAAAARIEAELRDTLKKQADEIEHLKKAKAEEVQSLLDQLIKTTGTATGQLSALGRANAAVSDAARRPWLDPIGTPDGPLTTRTSNAAVDRMTIIRPPSDLPP